MRLLGRDRSDASFTFEGQLLMPYIRAVINQQHILQEQVSRIHGLEEGLIRLGTFGSVSAHWLPGLLKTFLNTHPKIKFELIHGTNQESESRVRDGSLDLAFVLMLAASDLSFISLFHDPIVAVVLQSSTLALAEKLPLKMLENAPYIKLSEQVEDEFSTLLRRCHINPDARFGERDDEAVLAMVEKGLGVSLLPQLSLQGSS